MLAERTVVTVLTGARIITPDETVDGGAVVIDGGRIAEIGPRRARPLGAGVVDLPGLILVPGFIDLHVHGGGGLSLASPDPEQTRSYARWAVRRGVTSFLATVCAADIDEALAALGAGAAAVGPVDGGATVLGLNLEGPFVNPERRGALPASWPQPPDVAAFQALAAPAGGHLRLMTLAPELAGAGEVLRAAVAGGISVSVGHTDASYAEAAAAFRAGASHVTHAFNAMRPFHQREPGPVGAALDSPHAVIEVIADGVHLHPATVRLLLTAFGPERVALITDGVDAAGGSGGTFRIAGQEAVAEGGRVALADGTIAGSVATMDEVVRNAVAWGTPLADAARMASTVPARVAGAGGRKGRIAPGFDADLVALDSNLRVAGTWCGGRRVFAASV